MVDDATQSNEVESLLTFSDENQFNEQDSLLTWVDENSSNVSDSSSSSEDEGEDSHPEPPRGQKDVYVRHDGKILYGQDATDERKRSIAKRKALDIQKLLKAEKPSTFSVNVLRASATPASTHAFRLISKGQFNAMTAHAKGANASAGATAQVASISVANAHATGVNASASASASEVRVNVLNQSVSGLSTSASVNADGVSVAAGNVSVTGAEAAVSASASAARFTVGNVDITGASAGASAKVNGTGVTAFNACVGGPSAAASISADGSLSFGNINLGLRPSLDVGFGLNIGIPFLSGSRLGGGGGNNNNGNTNNNGEGTNNNNSGSNGANAGGSAGLQQRLLEKYPNQRYYANPVDYPITRNTSGEPIDPLLPDDGILRTDSNNQKVTNVVTRHNELVENGNKFVGFKGTPPTNNAPLETLPVNNNAGVPAQAGPIEERIWSGMYTSPLPDVAKGYTNDDRGNPGTISRVYVPDDSAEHYYTKIGLETAHGEGALRAVKEHSKGKYIFSGPQDSKNPDLFAPETVISPAVRNETLTAGTMKFEPSAHEIDKSLPKVILKEFHNQELKCSEIVPDYNVGVKTADDCARDGGRERLAHVFQGQQPHILDNDPPKKRELNEDDKLLLEECKKLGIEISPDKLDKLKTNIRSDEEYEREEDAQNRTTQGSSNIIAGTNSGERKESEQQPEESEKNPPEPCKNHASNVRCMKCMVGSSGPRIRNIRGRIFGFDSSK
ncbi:unnamed protein product [Adineta steineri]|uniref:Exotoxin A catalytic domain-containing protein n=1 Tax=Adineta steineri TaxID=433720 RepID=A0A814C6L3_9BILA|nr:unnamed protein product [Adineta steineri]CAF0965698.1 unnamed protein product [Adineta steineri]CAF3718655.1 unnamed protein product [Adineta steineri]CAF3727113.1 unnamed protein product [Adineta steineri]